MHAIPGSSSASNLLLLDVHEICPSTTIVSILRTRFRYKLQAASQAYFRLVKALMVLYVVHENSQCSALFNTFYLLFVCVCVCV